MYYKKSHKAFYVNRNGKAVRLGRTLEEAEANSIPNETAVLVERFLHHYEKQSTKKFYERHLKPFLKIAPTTFSRLQPSHLVTLLDKYDGNYKHCIAKAVKTCFAWLKERGRIETNPFKDIKTPPSIYRGDEAYVKNVQERIQAVPNKDLRDILTVICETGCRPQEARNIRRDNIQGDQVVFIKQDSKGNYRSRVIHLSERAKGVLDAAHRLADNGPLLRCDGEPWTSEKLSRACAKYGFTPYQLRHTFATNAILKGIDLVTVATLMGHSNLSMLMKVYQHVKLFDRHLKNAIDVVNG